MLRAVPGSPGGGRERKAPAKKRQGTPQYRSPGSERIAKGAPRTLLLSAKPAGPDAWRAILLYGRRIITDEASHLHAEEASKSSRLGPRFLSETVGVRSHL